MSGRLHSLFVTSGFTPMASKDIAEAQRKEGRHGIEVHVPPREEVPVNVYWRDKYLRPAHVRKWTTCFRKEEVQEEYYRNVAMVYAFTYQKVCACAPLSVEPPMCHACFLGGCGHTKFDSLKQANQQIASAGFAG
jgi:hypothetical protein